MAGCLFDTVPIWSKQISYNLSDHAHMRRKEGKRKREREGRRERGRERERERERERTVQVMNNYIKLTLMHINITFGPTSTGGYTCKTTLHTHVHVHVLHSVLTR